MSIRVIARFFSKDTSRETLEPLLMNLVEPIRHYYGCISCHLTQHKDDLNEFTFIEEWQDQASLDTHLASKHIQDAVIQINPHLSKPLELDIYNNL
jgi:quinol monooxygenase YgiN